MDFTGKETVILRVGTIDYPVSFSFSPCTSAVSNDGSIPFGTTIVSAKIRIKSKAKVDVTNAMGGESIVVSVVDGLIVNSEFDYPSTNVVKGACTVLIALTLSSDAVIVKRWDGLIIEV